MSSLIFIAVIALLLVSIDAFTTGFSRISIHNDLKTPKSLYNGRRTITAAVVEVGSIEEFDKAVKEAAGDALVVVDYSTTWCGPCKVIYPRYEELSEEYTDAIFLKVIGDSSQEASALMKREGIRSVPAFHFWKKGGRIDAVNGANADAIEMAIKDNI
mmetsp:Transcript_24190/g.31251  ORF Transcript_24190/g.31251 Transcript_24190/m.31251 type:complete len:158 (-) Transcript_24190:271-744(-)